MLQNKNKVFSIFYFIFGLILFLPSTSYADCTNPASPVGGISYDSAGDFMAVLACDGTDWVPWAGWTVSGFPAPQYSGGGGSSVWFTSASDIYYNSGNVGIGTANPQALLHIDGGTAPAFLRLEQNGTTPSIWDVNNNAGTGRFTINHVTSGKTPLKIEAGTDTSLLWLGQLASNNVSINGNLTVTGTCTGCGGGTPGGNDTEIQFNSSGSFDGSPNLTWDGATLSSTYTGTSPGTAAVYGDASNGTTNTLYGIWGQTASGGSAVYGNATATTGTTNGGYFRNNSTSGRGIYAIAEASSGNTYGVYGQSSSTGAGRGVYGVVSGSNNTGYGVYGTNASSSGFGGYFTNSGGGYAAAFMGGNVGIGTASPTVALDVVGDIHYTGQIVDVSDIRMKYEIKPLDNPLAKLTSLNGFSFKMKGDEKKTIEYGVAAQDVQKVFPELVSQVDKDGTLGVNYSGLIAPLIEAMKEQQAEIEALRAEIELLKAERNNKPSNKPGEL